MSPGRQASLRPCTWCMSGVHTASRRTTESWPRPGCTAHLDQRRPQRVSAQLGFYDPICSCALFFALAYRSFLPSSLSPTLFFVSHSFCLLRCNYFVCQHFCSFSHLPLSLEVRLRRPWAGAAWLACLTHLIAPSAPAQQLPEDGLACLPEDKPPEMA